MLRNAHVGSDDDVVDVVKLRVGADPRIVPDRELPRPLNSDSVPDQDALAGFIGLFFGVYGVLSLIVQLFVSGRVLNR